MVINYFTNRFRERRSRIATESGDEASAGAQSQ